MRILPVLTGTMLLILVTSAAAQAAVVRVPADHATIQEAVDSASDGDVIRVARGEYCGATISKEVHLLGSAGTTIVGCAAPALGGGLRVGFLLADERASGTTIAWFGFDGAGVSDTNLAPLAFSVFGRDAHGVSVVGTYTRGTVQAISNSNGEGWFIAANVIRDLTLFSCPGHCGGGSAIVIQKRIDDGELAFGNTVLANLIVGAIPDGHDDFDMTGVFVLGQERPVVAGNRISIPANPAAGVQGIGIQVTSSCCGLPDEFPRSHGAIIVDNDGRGSELALVIDAGNADGARIHHNRGVNVIEGVISVVP